MKMLTSAASLLGILLAILAVFVTLPVDTAMVLVILGLIAGLNYRMDMMVGLFLAVLLYPIAAAAVATIPSVGPIVGAILENIGIAASGVAAMVLIRRVADILKGNVDNLMGKKAD